MENGVRLDPESIRNLGKNIVAETEVLLQMIEKARNQVAESGRIFDSPAARDFRTSMEKFATNAANGSKTSLTNLADYFETVAKEYEKTDAEVADVANQFLEKALFE